MNMFVLRTKLNPAISVGRKNFLHLCIFYSTHCTNVLKVLFSLSADKNETTVFGNSIDGIRSTPKGQPKGHTMLNHLHGNEEKTKDLLFLSFDFFYVTLSKDGFFFFAQGNVLVLRQ